MLGSVTKRLGQSGQLKGSTASDAVRARSLGVLDSKLRALRLQSHCRVTTKTGTAISPLESNMCLLSVNDVFAALEVETGRNCILASWCSPQSTSRRTPCRPMLKLMAREWHPLAGEDDGGGAQGGGRQAARVHPGLLLSDALVAPLWDASVGRPPAAFVTWRMASRCGRQARCATAPQLRAVS